MGLKAKENNPSGDMLPPKPGAPAPANAKAPKINEDVERRLNPYIDANRDDFERYHTLAKENPERAARSMMLKDLDRLEREVSLNKNQIAGAKQWLANQPKETQQFIEQRLAETTHPLQRDMALLRAVTNRMTFENKQALGRAAKLAA